MRDRDVELAEFSLDAAKVAQTHRLERWTF